MTSSKLPRTIGTFESAEVSVSTGRFGPYIKHLSAFYSLGKDDDPLTVTLERAIEIIVEKRKKEDQKTIKAFPEDTLLKILNGRYGAYISYDKKNYKIPKGSDPAALTLEDCRKIIRETEPSNNKNVKRKK